MDLASHSPRATRPNTSCSYGGDASHSGYGPRESRVGLPLPEEAFDGTSLLEQEQGCFPVPPALERAATFPDGPGSRDSLRFTPPVLRLMESEAGGLAVTAEGNREQAEFCDPFCKLACELASAEHPRASAAAHGSGAGRGAIRAQAEGRTDPTASTRP